MGKIVFDGWIEIICGPMFSGKTEEFLRFIVSINDKSRVFINNVNGASYITLLNDSSFPVVKGDILYGSVYLNNVLTTKIIYNF